MEGAALASGCSTPLASSPLRGSPLKGSPMRDARGKLRTLSIDVESRHQTHSTESSPGSRGGKLLINLDRPSNFERFLAAVTPVVKVEHDERASDIKDDSLDWAASRAARSKFRVPSFSLNELWEAYEEWSAVGVSVPMRLESGLEAEQFYVPYLSSIHLYKRENGGTSVSSEEDDNIMLGFESDETLSTGSGSSGSSEYSGCHVEGIEIMGNGGAHSNNHKSSRAEMKKLRCLYKYVEEGQPFHRVPFSEKIEEIAETFPEIKTLRSDSVHSMSWIAVAWYPLYMVPQCPAKVNTAFLTFHSISPGGIGEMSPMEHKEFAPASPTLSSMAEAFLSMRASDSMCSSPNDDMWCEKDVYKVRPFGCTPHRLSSTLWLENDIGNSELHLRLLSSAKFWLTRVEEYQPDHSFFSSRSSSSKAGASARRPRFSC